jgi:hypothetical protein
VEILGDLATVQIVVFERVHVDFLPHRACFFPVLLFPLALTSFSLWVQGLKCYAVLPLVVVEDVGYERDLKC